jgi:L-amino acid N-acyltransferase YncA
MLSVRRVEASEFISQVLPVLAEREVENNLIVGLAQRLAGDPDAAATAVLAVVETGGALVGAALRTPPRFPIVTRLPEGAARVLAQFFSRLGDVPDGAIGPEDHGRDLALVFAEQRGGRLERASDEIIYELRAVRPPARPPGSARPATPDDLPVVTEYMAAFFREIALPHPPDPAEHAQRAITESRPLLWDDGGVRSMACRARRTLRGAAIAPVYTPPEARGRGYGSAVTAALCQRLLDAGSKFVCLHADRANKTSNHIYQAIGFEEVCGLGVWSVA